MKACKKGHHDGALDIICHLYHSDFDKEQMHVQLQLLHGRYSFDVVPADAAMHIFHVKEYFLPLSQGQRLLMSQVQSHFSSSFSKLYGEIVECATTSQKLLAHDDAAGTSELSDRCYTFTITANVYYHGLSTSGCT